MAIRTIRTNNARKRELRALHDTGRLRYVEERRDPTLDRKVWEVEVNGTTLLLTTDTIDGFLIAARALLTDPAPSPDRQDAATRT